MSVFRSRFFWKLYATYACLVLATTLVVGVLVHRQMVRSLTTKVAASLRDKTRLLAPYSARAFSGGLQRDQRAEIERLARDTNIRITLIAPDGTVVVDSEKNPAEMDNHGDRPEVVQAQTEPYGLSQRYSQTLRMHMLYSARQLRRGGKVLGTVRTSMPLADVQKRLSEMRATVVAGAAFGVLVALAVGVVVARQVTAPLTEMTTAAAALREGRYDAQVRSRSNDEIGLLGDTLNRLGTELTERIARITRDQAELRAMIAGMVEGVIAVDDDDRVVHCNRAARSLLGIEGEVDGQKFWEVVRLADLVQLLGDARSRREPFRRETVIYRNGSEVVLEAHATAFSTADAGGLVMVLHDISELRRLERIRRDFVANVSHELKTPLTSIKGYVETLLTGALHDENNNVRFLEKIDVHVARLNDLVADLLGLARIEAREATLPLFALDWRPIAEEALRRHEAVYEGKNLSCRVEGDCGLVMGDAEGMTQVVDNLLDNAIKYTPSGGSVTVRLSATDGRFGLLIVEDTGLGIPDDEQDRIFERFYRVDKARSRELGGTGLGLSIVKHFVQAMQGEIDVHSEMGKGSRFTVRLTLAAARS